MSSDRPTSPELISCITHMIVGTMRDRGVANAVIIDGWSEQTRLSVLLVAATDA
jgi:hypothetical protein